MLELVRLASALLNAGFYRKTELNSLIVPLLHILDGRQDTVDTNVDDSDADGQFARYQKKKTNTCDTLVIMEAKRCVTPNSWHSWTDWPPTPAFLPMAHVLQDRVRYFHACVHYPPRH